MEDENLKNLLLSYPELQCISPTRIRCTLTGHEMPTHYETVLRFVQGAKFQRVKCLKNHLQQHEQYFKDKGAYLFCKVTGRRVTKDGFAVEKHINGRRFRNALARGYTADENGNEMELSPMDDHPTSSEPRLIDDSDNESDDLIRNQNYDEDTISSNSSIRDVEAVANGDLYPELAGSDNGGGADSDYDFNAMDTEFDDDKSAKRKGDAHFCETPVHKRRRC